MCHLRILALNNPSGLYKKEHETQRGNNVVWLRRERRWSRKNPTLGLLHVTVAFQRDVFVTNTVFFLGGGAATAGTRWSVFLSATGGSGALRRSERRRRIVPE